MSDDADQPDAAGESAASPPTNGPRRIAPARPWAQGSTRPAPPQLPVDANTSASGREGSGAARPWERRPLTPPAPPSSGQDAADAARRGLGSARPWDQSPADPSATPPEATKPIAPGDGPATPMAPMYPWQRRDVDFDLKGAATWDPSDYPDDEDESGIKARSKKAAGWLFARRDDPEPQFDREPDLTESTAPDPTPANRTHPHPRPARTASLRPRPAATAEPTPAPRPRPRPAAAAAATATAAPAAAPESPAESGSRSGPDLTKFLAASEPQPGDDDKEPKQKKERKPEKQKDERKPNPVLKALRGNVRRLVRYAIVVGIVVGVALLLRAFVVSPVYIPSASMEPTLHGCPNCNDDYVLVDKVSYRLHDPRRRDIVVFDRPATFAGPDDVLIKRVVATGGQTVTLRGGQVFVDNLKLNEPYVNKACGPNPTRPLTARTTWRIPDGSIFVMGDNRCNSEDGRAFGPIPVSSVIGRAWLIFWPVSRFGTVD